jgi:hypothetical protein
MGDDDKESMKTDILRGAVSANADTVGLGALTRARDGPQ